MVAVASHTSLDIGDRDRRIIELARNKIRGPAAAFDDAMRALSEAVEELIPDGRIFLLGHAPTGPIVGSLLSGVGIVEVERGIQLVRGRRNSTVTSLGWFAR